MNKNTLLLLGLGVVVLYFYEKSQTSTPGTTSGQTPCAPGYTNVNNTCIPVTSQIPCATGYTNVNGQCVANPYTNFGVDPITQILESI